MLEMLGLATDSNTTTTMLAIVAAALSFVIAVLVFLCDQPLLDPRFEGDTKSSRRHDLEHRKGRRSPQLEMMKAERATSEQQLFGFS
jgi:hypothetical protein